MYNFNLLKHIKDNLLVTLRTSSIIQLAYVLLYPVQKIYLLFIAYRTQTNNALSYNSQYPNVQRLLNDKIDSSLRRIKVYDNQNNFPVISYYEIDNVPVITNFIIYHETYYVQAAFIVSLPAVIYNNNNKKNQIEKLVNQYKFCQTKYLIINE